MNAIHFGKIEDRSFYASHCNRKKLSCWQIFANNIPSLTDGQNRASTSTTHSNYLRAVRTSIEKSNLIIKSTRETTSNNVFVEYFLALSLSLSLSLSFSLSFSFLFFRTLKMNSAVRLDVYFL